MCDVCGGVRSLTSLRIMIERMSAALRRSEPKRTSLGEVGMSSGWLRSCTLRDCSCCREGAPPRTPPLLDRRRAGTGAPWYSEGTPAVRATPELRNAAGWLLLLLLAPGPSSATPLPACKGRGSWPPPPPAAPRLAG